MPTRPRLLLRTFITGLLAALPVVATLAIVVWIGTLLWSWLGPTSLLGGMLVALGLGGTGSIVAGYLLGLLLLAVAIFALGLLVEARLEKGLAALVNGFMRRIPFVRGLYDMIRRIVDLVSQRDAEGLKTMSPVWCHFGGPGGAAVIGLLSTPDAVSVGGRACLCVMLPTAPVPIGGVLLYVPVEWVEPADIGMEGLTSLYVSMGVTSGQYLKKAEPAEAARAPAAQAAPSSDA
jgi:uncharacterized membrane protein